MSFSSFATVAVTETRFVYFDIMEIDDITSLWVYFFNPVYIWQPTEMFSDYYIRPINAHT